MARIVIDVDSKNAVQAISAIETSLENADIDLRRLETDAKKTGKTFRSVFNRSLSTQIGGLFAGIGAIAATRSLIQVADEMSGVRARVRSVTDTTEEYQKAQKGLFDISQKTGTQIAANTNSFARLNGAIKEIGGDTSDTLGVVETLNKAFVINGSTSEETASVMLQFAQAMGSGKLQGEELRAVLEGNAFFGRKLAEALGTDIAGLRDMAAAGELTTDVLLKAFPKIKDSVDETFNDIPVTVSRAFTEVENAIKRSIGLLDEQKGTSSELAKSIQGVARAIENNQDAIATFAEGLASIASLGVNSFGVISNAIGILVGGVLTLASFMSDGFEAAWATITITAQNAFAAIADVAAETLTGAIALLNKIPGVEIDIEPAIVQRLKEIEGSAVSLEDKLNQIARTGRAVRQGYVDQANEQLAAIKTIITGTKEVETAQKQAVATTKASINDLSVGVKDVGITFNEATKTWEFGLQRASEEMGKARENINQIKKTAEETKGSTENIVDIKPDIIANDAKTAFSVVTKEGRGSIKVVNDAAVKLQEAPKPFEKAATQTFKVVQENGESAAKAIDRAFSDLASKNYTVNVQYQESYAAIARGDATARTPTASSNRIPESLIQQSRNSASGSSSTQDVNLNMTFPGSSQSVTVPTTQSGATGVINEVTRLNRRQS